MTTEETIKSPRKKTIAVVSFTNPDRDPRVARHLDFLSERYDVISVGVGECRRGDVRFVPLPMRGRSRLEKLTNATKLICGSFESSYWNQPIVVDALDVLSNMRADVWLANDLETLPLVLHVAGRSPVIFDAHEYAPLQFEDRLEFRLLFQRYNRYLVQEYVSKVCRMMTVSNGIAQRYQQDTGVSCDVVWNATAYHEQEPTPVDPKRIRLVHHGKATRSRQLESIIEIMRHTDPRFELSMYLVPSDVKYLDWLKRQAAAATRISFHSPVPMAQLATHLNQYDIGIAYFKPTTFNLLYVLPNKFFEFVQARLAIAIGPSPEMARIVQQHQLGIVSDAFDPRELAGRLNQLKAEDIMKFKQQSHSAAKGLSSDSAESTVQRVVGDEATNR